VAVLRWLKNQVDQGITISEAAAELTALRSRGLWPELVPSLEPASATSSAIPPQQYSEDLYKAFLAQDEPKATALLNEAQSYFDLLTLCTEVISPCLVMIGDAWHRGEILISTEHLASNYLRGRLTTLLQSFPSRRGAPYIIVACAYTDQHEIGSLMLATILRREGYRVEYLGTGVPNEDLVDFVRSEKPALLCLAASSEEAARDLPKIQKGLIAAGTATKLGFGGRAFSINPRLCAEMPGTFLGSNIRDAQVTIRQLLESY
jgi:methanogenic corrinoid protein MtbC1